MTASKTLLAGILLLSSSLAADTCGCTAQHTIDTFEHGAHGAAYYQPCDLPGMCGGLYYNLSIAYEQPEGGPCSGICPSSIPYELGFNATSDPMSNKIYSYDPTKPAPYSPIDYFWLKSFDFGCTSIQPWTFSDGSKTTAEVPVNCALDVFRGDYVHTLKYTAKFTPHIQIDNYTGLPYAEPVKVRLPNASWNNTNMMWLGASGKNATAKNLFYYLDTFEHFNYYCPRDVAQ